MTVNEIANELGISHSNLLDRLEMLAHLGYLKKIESCCEADNNTVEHLSKDNNDLEKYVSQNDPIPKSCKYCILSKSCSEINRDAMDRDELVGFELTKKGRDLLSGKKILD
jgi:hypothetical protein